MNPDPFPVCDELKAWAKAECDRQSATRQVDYDRMLEATRFCFSPDRPLWGWCNLIESMGIMVDPEKNQGFRCQPVTIGGKVIPVVDFVRSVQQISEMAQHHDITPAEWYQEFETLHPFNDGNGRVGAIIYNYLLYSDSNAMQVPPEFIKNPQ